MPRLSFLVSLVVVSLALSFSMGTAPVAAQPLVVLDPGHGGSDPGAVGCSLEEEDVVLDVMQRLRVLLEGAGVRVAMTRDADTTVGLSARATFANSRSATVFVSIHSNANGGTPATGTETFVYPGSGARTRELGSGVQAAMIAAWGLSNRGLKEGNFAVIRETSMPATLGELAFTNRCTPDAALLGDPTARQRMAEHLRDAVLDWLGISPTTPSTGTLRGVVFEDQGVGTEDLTVRLPGASVRVVESGAAATAAGDGAWSFTVAPGDYTVEASNGGHVTTSRRCTVTAGATTWCSIGLLPEAAVETDAGLPPVEEDAGAIEEVDAGTERDAGASPDVDAGPGREPVAGCGCVVGASGGRGGWLAILGVLGCLAVRRRRARATGATTLLGALSIAVLSIAVLAVGCGREVGVAGGDLAIDPTRSEEIGLAPLVVTLGEPREWLAPGYVSPLLSPDGTHALLASEDQRALFVADLEGGDFREVCQVGRCGWEPRWQDDGAAVAYRVEGQSGTAVPAEAVTLAGEPVAPRVGERGVHAWVDDDDRAWLRIDGRTRAIGLEGERVMMPQLTDDHRHVVLWGLSEGVMVHRVADGRVVRLGAGGHPRVDPSGRWLVFERTDDDGHAITHADLFVVDLDDPSYAVMPLVTSGDRLERMPSLSRIGDGGAGTLAYLVDGALVVRPVRLAR